MKLYETNIAYSCFVPNLHPIPSYSPKVDLIPFTSSTSSAGCWREIPEKRLPAQTGGLSNLWKQSWYAGFDHNVACLQTSHHDQLPGAKLSWYYS